uniref:Uncharacterized protein n=1 Tax=Lotus japonicus TaxID=34305 RepID=I3S8U7_LOTJA|nr:unknown [Lotus japonicus]
MIIGIVMKAARSNQTAQRLAGPLEVVQAGLISSVCNLIDLKKVVEVVAAMILDNRYKSQPPYDLCK